MEDNRAALPEAAELESRDKIPLGELIVTEGKYDKARLLEIFDAVIIETNGFGIFKDRELCSFIAAYGKKHGIIIATDSDRAGFIIRNRVSALVSAEKITHVYIPDIAGKEKRKSEPSREGKLGVEGIPSELIIAAFEKAGVCGKQKASGEKISAVQLYEAGLIGAPGSRERRNELKRRLGLPERLSTKALLRVLETVGFEK